MSLREWSLGRVLIVAVLWTVAALLLMGWPSYSTVNIVAERGPLSGVGVELPYLLKFCGLALVPLLALVVAWMVQRR
jgi:hypothetical protein